MGAWQLLAAGWTRRRIDDRVQRHGWRVVHPGVYALGNAPLTQRQLWVAATLTTPHSVLGSFSAGACLGFRSFDADFETIVRPGSRGRLVLPRLVVFHSTSLEGDRTHHDGIPITTAARTLIDLAPRIGAKSTARALREALRLKVITFPQLRATLMRHEGRRGTRLLKELTARYSGLPYDRTRSNAEARALEVLRDAGSDPPLVNTRIAGEEADLAWPPHRLIIELDGPQFHRFADEDARKERVWEAAGYTVERLSTDAVYEEPHRLVALARETAPPKR